MKNKLKKALKLGILIFGFSLLLWNCDVMEESTHQEVPQENTMSKISFEEFKSKANLNGRAKNISRFFDVYKSSTKPSSNNKINAGFEDATILTDNIIKIKKDNFTTYTFTIITETENNEFYNLVLYVNDKQEIYKSHILKYTPSDKWISDRTQYFSGSVKIINNDVFDVKNLLQSKTSSSAKTSSFNSCIDRVTITYACSNGVEGHREGNPGSPYCTAHDFYYYIDITYVSCTTSSDNNSGNIDPFSGNNIQTPTGDGGGGSSNDNSGIVTAPNTIPYTSQLKNFESGTLNATERTYYNRDSNTKNTIDRFLIERNFSNIAKTDAKTALDFSSKYKLIFEQFNWVFNNSASEDLQELKSFLVEMTETTTKIESIVKAVIDSEIKTNNKAEIDYDDIIINELEGKALCVYNKLMASSTGFKNAIKNFDGEFPVSHLKFNLKDLDDDTRGETSPPNKFIIEITLNNDISDSGVNYRPNLLTAKTIIHEVIHAEMFRKLLSLANNNGSIDITILTRMLQQSDYPGMLDYYTRFGGINGFQHQQMAAHYRETIARMLQEFDTGIPIPANQQPQQLYLDLSWEGLIYTNIVSWQNIMNDTERARIENVISNYITNNLDQTCTD